MRKKLLLVSCCMALCILSVACDKSSKNTSNNPTQNSVDVSEEEDSETDDTSDENTEYLSQSQVFIDEDMAKEQLASDSITVSIGDIKGFYRSYGTSSIIEYLSEDNENEGLIDFLVYSGNTIESVANSRKVYVNDEDYGNKLSNSEEISLESNGFTYSVVLYTYTHNGRTVTDALMMTAPTENDVVAILYTLYDQETINEQKLTDIVSAVQISAVSSGKEDKEDEVTTETSETESQDDTESQD